LLSDLYKNENSKNEFKNIIFFEKEKVRSFFSDSSEDEDKKYKERWELWCTAMRYDSFKCLDNMKTFKVGVSQESPTLKSISLRARIIDGMLFESSPEKIDAMWDIRRNTAT